MSAHGADLTLDEVVPWLTRRIRARVRAAPRRAPLSEAAGEAHRIYEANVRDLPSDHLACKAGCGGCCRAHVGVEPAEGFAIARHLRTGLSDTDLAILRDRIAHTAARVADLDPGPRWEAQIPCAFLDAGESCAIYPARPLACRGYTSTDLAACDASAETRDHSLPIPADPDRLMRATMLRHALAAATARTLSDGKAPDHMELHVAVTVALEIDERAWIKRRPGN